MLIIPIVHTFLTKTQQNFSHGYRDITGLIISPEKSLIKFIICTSSAFQNTYNFIEEITMSFFHRKNPYLERHNDRSRNPYLEKGLRIPVPQHEEIERPTTPRKSPKKQSFEVDFDINKGE
jgi:hypothetical protein